MKSIRSLIVAWLTALLVIPGVAAATSHSTLNERSDAQTVLTTGEVRKVDKDAKKLTIRHAPIESLDMPAMTMVFQVKDRSVLDRVKPGDKVKFAAVKIKGAFTVTDLEVTK